MLSAKKISVFLLSFMALAANANSNINAKPLPNGLLNPEDFKNKTINGMKIRDCMPTLSDNAKAAVGLAALNFGVYNACSDKNSKQLAEIAKNDKVNFAGKYILTLIPDADFRVEGKTHFTYLLIEPTTKEVVGMNTTFFTSDNKKPLISYTKNDTKACTKKGSKQEVFVMVPTPDGYLSNKVHSSGQQCIEFKNGKLYSVNYEEYMKHVNG